MNEVHGLEYRAPHYAFLLRKIQEYRVI